MISYRVIDKMETVVREGIWLPFGWRALNADVVLDLIEKLRSTLPEDGARTRRGAESADGDGGAGPPATPAAERPSVAAGSPKDETELIARAQSRADDIIADAQAAARDIRRGADEYADHVLESLDASLAKALAAVQKGRQTLATSVTNGKSPREMSTL
jgi:cell division septum initiation protein DivIVA